MQVIHPQPHSPVAADAAKELEKDKVEVGASLQAFSSKVHLVQLGTQQAMKCCKTIRIGGNLRRFLCNPILTVQLHDAGARSCGRWSDARSGGRRRFTQKQ